MTHYPIFRRIQLADLPGHTPAMKLYLQLVDGFGMYKLAIELHDLAQDIMVTGGKGPSVFFPSPLAVREILLGIPPLPIQHSGRYDLIVFGNGQEIDRQQFKVVVSENDGGNET